jgi:segregation and condensation protein B
MPSDYSTPPAPESEWVKGELPQATEKAKQIKAAVNPPPAATPPAPAAEPAPTPAPAADGELSLESLVESLLFVADGPTPVSQISAALDTPAAKVEAALKTLGETLAHNQRGVRLQRHRDKVQLTTAPFAAAYVEKFLGLAAATHLTRAALETLAIIAYQQPVTRPQIEGVRGVNCDSVLQNLLNKGLIEEAGRTEGPGRPVLYAVTPEFLQHFGLTSLAELPPLGLDSLPAPASLNPEAHHDSLLKG